ncbi:Bacteroides conjugative transposon TraM protein [Tangfeifania diversioriginum]|uniref:Bacteroides conjugative transposon TraM protein n=1 Tax=Tangfeifania diversioriginum TaxID=1168035 RepID=A0A1M6MQV6_9BACT|nr:conjugative transposon protein TraM [Tangfeifania diversioriginum]SHJ85663.1 Bacteroides conjugative transposon TraM protein [Tangfeifania diversioriginum]
MKENNNKTGQRKVLPPEQLQKRKKMVIFPLMFAAFAVAMYFIFMPSSQEGDEKQGLNTDLPIPKNEIIGDKKTAYEMELFEQKKNWQTLSLEDYGIKPDTVKSRIITSSTGGYTSQKAPESSIRSSAEAYKKVSSDLNTFYNEQQVSSREKELEKQVEMLQDELEEKENTDSVSRVDQQLKLMEESYKMAAKYMPQGQVQQLEQHQDQDLVPEPLLKESRNIVPVAKLGINETSALLQQVEDSVFLNRYSQPVNTGFYTAGGNLVKVSPNTVKACIHNDQVIVSGQNVKIRLLEPVKAGGIIVPVNEMVTGIAVIQGERLNITISSLEYRGRIIPVEISVYDTDGQSGIFIPGSVETTALKEVAASMGQGAGTSISINQGTTAGQQLAADVGRGFIQGASQYVSKKLRTPKVTIKAGHRLLLMPSN